MTSAKHGQAAVGLPRASRMRYTITRAVFGLRGDIEITEQEFLATKRAKDNLVLVATVEEKFDVLLENYLEYEQSLLAAALTQLVHPIRERDDFMADRRTITRRLVNLLTAARAYVDQVNHDLCAIDGESAVTRQTLDNALSLEYDRSPAYRAMTEIRKHVQHRSMFLGVVGFPSNWVEESPENPIGKLRFRVVPTLDVRQIEADAKCKASVLSELKAKAAEAKADGDEIPLTPLVREYVESLARAHESLRKTLADDVKRWEAQLESIEAQARSALEGPMVGLAVVAANEDTRQILYLAREDIVNYRRSLESQNRIFEKLSRRYVSGEQ